MVIRTFDTSGNRRRFPMTFKSRVLVLALVASAAGCSASSGGVAPPLSSDASLSDLVITADGAPVALSVAFDKEVHAYAAVLRAGTQELTLTATATDPAARAISLIPLGGAATALTSGGAAPLAIPAAGTTAAYRILVTASDGKSTAGYTLRLSRNEAGAVSSLSSLTDSAGVLAFSSGTTSYTYQVPELQAVGYTVTPTPTDPFASMTINGTAALSGTPAAVDLTSGSATVTIVVTAENGVAQTTYTLHVSVTQIIPTPPVATITVAGAGGATVINGLGNTLQLTPTVLPANAVQAVTWSSSDTAVATVSASGLVTSRKAGEVTITASATDSSGVTGSVNLISGGGVAIFVTQPGAVGVATSTATLSSGTLAVANTYGTSGNAFKFVSGVGFYGTNSNGFVSLPFPLHGDFSMTATVVATQSNKANNACGLGLGVTTGFLATDQYAYVFMPATPVTGASVGTKYVNSASNVTSGTALAATTFNIAAGASAITLTMSRVGTTYTLGAGSATTTIDATLMSGTSAYGGGAVYPAISFNNLVASVTGLVVRDAAGNVIFDSATGTLQSYIPASLTLSSPTATVVMGATPSTVTATAVQPGGGTAAVSAVPVDNTVVGVAVTNGASSSTLTLTGLKVGSTNVTVTNTADPNPATNTKTLAVTVETFNASDAYTLSALPALLYPAPGATTAYADGELSITFDGPPTLATGGSIDIYDLTTSNLVDRIFFANETQVVSSYATTPATSVPIKVGAQLARVSGNTLYFTPHFGALQYGTSYYVAISTTAITGAALAGTPFTGLSNARTVATWRFQTRPTPALGTTIAVDGSQATTTADFRTVGGALMYLAAHPVPAATAVRINVAAGTYTELVNYRGLPTPGLTITVAGPAGNTRGDNAVIQYAVGGVLNGQSARASFYFAGANLVLENLTLRSTGTKAQLAQAETLYFDSRGDYRVAVNNCSFISNQDTINTSGRAWFYNSYIEGNTDFIWGTSDVALFENCALKVTSASTDAASTVYAIFVARTGTTGAATIGKGYVLLNSTVDVAAASGYTVAYGRNAGGTGFYDQVALIGNTFSGTGTLFTNMWQTSASTPLFLAGYPSYVGWKSAGNTGLTADVISPIPTGVSLSIAGQAAEYDTRDHILNRVISVSGGVPTYAPAATTWDVSGMFGLP
jgi:pectin methylesterase-like acyl-CoA thioesterase